MYSELDVVGSSSTRIPSYIKIDQAEKLVRIELQRASVGSLDGGVSKAPWCMLLLLKAV